MLRQAVRLNSLSELAITKLEAAVDLSSAADLLAALGWGRYRANRWCDETQDRADLEATLDNAEEGASEAPVADLCVRRASLHQAAEELGTAIDGAPSREHLATWELHRAEVALALGATDDALRSARVAVCAHDDRAGRELLGTLLFRLGHRVGTSDAREALRLYLASLAVAPNPEVLLMDEPCSALDPIATAQVEELIDELRSQFSVVIVTHSMQQAARVSDFTAYMYLGELVEFGLTDEIFIKPTRKETEDYITGRFG